MRIEQRGLWDTSAIFWQIALHACDWTESSLTSPTTATLKQLTMSNNLRKNFCLGENLLVSLHPVSTQEVSLHYSGLYQIPTAIVVLINLEILELFFSQDRCIRVFLHKHHKDESSGWKSPGQAVPSPGGHSTMPNEPCSFSLKIFCQVIANISPRWRALWPGFSGAGFYWLRTQYLAWF